LSVVTEYSTTLITTCAGLLNSYSPVVLKPCLHEEVYNGKQKWFSAKKCKKIGKEGDKNEGKEGISASNVDLANNYWDRNDRGDLVCIFG
jgi:hypothetical protein